MSRAAAASQNLQVNQALTAEEDVLAATSQAEALEAAINAAEHYMKALSLSSTSKDKKALDAKCKDWLLRAERIKVAKDWRLAILDHGSNDPVTRYPRSVRKLTTREEIILLESAKLNHAVFPPWSSAPGSDEFERQLGEDLFTDSPELHLSNQQRDVFAGWKRPKELLLQKHAGETDSSTVPAMAVTEKTDLVQDMVTDCSVVASLCAITSRYERGIDRLHYPVVYPCDLRYTDPKLSPSGKYIFCFYFNGCFRKVVIDDRLPSSKKSRSLHVVDRSNPCYIWPALVEKAYLKLRGGYDFPGSNSGTDLWVLTGWIPEQVFLHHEDVTGERIWRRLYKAFQAGDVLLTIGTGRLTEREQEEVGLVSEHDYAILDMKETKSHRQMLVKNPWAGDYDHDSNFELSSGYGDTSQVSPGTFWMDCEDVLQNFENLYLNWNPSLFRCRQDLHFTWDLTTDRGLAGCFAKNPQFSVSSNAGGTVWLLLGKHFRTVDHHDEFGPSAHCDEPGFISLYVFDAGGQRVSLSDGALHRGPYVDSPNTLMRLDMPSYTTYTVAVSEQSLPSAKQNFTLSALSFSPVSIAHAQNKYKFTTKVHGSWTPSTAGGNAESARYPFNPQFSFKISSATDISLLLEPEEPDLATHVKLFWSNGQRISRVRSRDIAADSGDYRRGGSLAEKLGLSKGIYTIVCSTFAPDQLGSFNLWVSSSGPCDVKPLAPEAAGRRAVISDIGVLSPGKDRMLAPLETPRLTRLKIIGRSRQSTIANRSVGPSPMLMTVELGQGPYKEILATSEDGNHSDAISGVRIEDFNLHPNLEDRGGAWVVIERIGGPGGQVEDHFEVEILGEEKVYVGEWIVEDA